MSVGLESGFSSEEVLNIRFPLHAAQTSSRWRTPSTGGRLYTGLHTSARYIIITHSKSSPCLNVHKYIRYSP